MNSKSQQFELNERKWDRRSATYDHKRFDYFRRMQRQVLGLIDLKPGLHFLDIGCGTGWAVRYMAERLQDAGEFCGVDISGAMIEIATAQAHEHPDAHFYKSSAEQLPLDNNTVDCAICTNSFHHYPDPAKVLIEIQRVLAPAGRLYILDVTTDDFFLRWVDGQVKQREKEHVHFYSSLEYQRLFLAAQLKHVDSRLIAYPMKVHLAEK
jgi:ubiquinone/menaquinone biosynthesis C-methylase UbiE